MQLEAKLEAVLFIAGRALTTRRLAALLAVNADEIEVALTSLGALYESDARGIRLLRNGGEVQLVTSPTAVELVQKFQKEETTGELTKPALETLSIIAYRGPVSKADLEKVRGVNCSLILRNLLMRGLIVAEENKRLLTTYYTVSTDFLRHLGLTNLQELPDYQDLHNPEVVERLLTEEQQPAKSDA